MISSLNSSFTFEGLPLRRLVHQPRTLSVWVWVWALTVPDPRAHLTDRKVSMEDVFYHQLRGKGVDLHEVTKDLQASGTGARPGGPHGGARNLRTRWSLDGAIKLPFCCLRLNITGD